MRNKLILILSTALLGGLGVVALAANSASVQTVYMGVSTVLLLTVSVGGVLSYVSQESSDIRDVWREKIRMLNNKISILEDDSIKLQKIIINLESQIEKSRAAAPETNSEQFCESLVVRHVAHK